MLLQHTEIEMVALSHATGCAKCFTCSKSSDLRSQRSDPGHKAGLRPQCEEVAEPHFKASLTPVHLTIQCQVPQASGGGSMPGSGGLGSDIGGHWMVTQEEWHEHALHTCAHTDRHRGNHLKHLSSS